MTKRIRSKNYQKASVSVSSEKKEVTLTEAVELAKKGSYAKFRASLELHLNLNIDPKKTDQKINFTTTLPFSTGKTKRVVVITNPEKQSEAEKAGADEVGGKELIERIAQGWLGFDALVASPDMMSELASVARILGPKGLMPNPKNGTVSMDVATAVGNLKKGQMTIKMGDDPALHLVVGNDEQKTAEVVANIEHIMTLLNANRPAKLKGNLIKSAFLAPTMGPSFKLSL